MSTLPSIEGSARLRARRWDAVVLGSGISALVASIRLGLAGHRVLVVEETAAHAAHPALREPFFLAGSRDGGLVDSCLRELSFALIDQRRIAPSRIAYQIVDDAFRLDIGEPGPTAEELTTWNVADPTLSLALLRGLRESAEAELQAMLDAPAVRIGRKLGRGRGAHPGSHLRGLPGEAADPDPTVARLLDAQIRALSNLGTTLPSPEARARLLGSVLAGGAGFEDGPPWLHGLLARRVESVYGEFRRLSRDFELISVDGQPGVHVVDTGELWVGRALVIAAPFSALASVIDTERAPAFLSEARTRSRRSVVHLSVPRRAVPEAMAARVISLGPEQGAFAGRCVSLAISADPDDPQRADLIGRMTLLADESDKSAADEIERRVRGLLPFSEREIVHRPVQRPRWDDDDWLEDPPPGIGWPGDCDLRVSSRPPVYRLDRAGVAGLGIEGDLLLGWRGGDAIAHDLS